MNRYPSPAANPGINQPSALVSMTIPPFPRFCLTDCPLTCGHGQEDGEFFAAITIGEIRLAQASFDHLAKSHRDLVSLDMAVSVVEVIR